MVSSEQPFLLFWFEGMRLNKSISMLSGELLQFTFKRIEVLFLSLLFEDKLIFTHENDTKKGKKVKIQLR
uniref:Uncharacterized protein n=1 Tax=Lotus japonicus TaxID=34305 RepID=I3SRA8_LOTJA|nr:unknown [Lotus japonicus]